MSKDMKYIISVETFMNRMSQQPTPTQTNLSQNTKTEHQKYKYITQKVVLHENPQRNNRKYSKSHDEAKVVQDLELVGFTIYKIDRLNYWTTEKNSHFKQIYNIFILKIVSKKS